MTIMLCSSNMWAIQDLSPFASNSSQREKKCTILIQIQGYHCILGPGSRGFPNYHELVSWFLSWGKKGQ